MKSKGDYNSEEIDFLKFYWSLNFSNRRKFDFTSISMKCYSSL